MKGPRARGTGRVYQPKGCKLWYIRYYANHKYVTEPTGMEKQQAAEQLLKRRLGKVSEGTFVEAALKKTLVAELYKDMLTDYDNNGQRSKKQLEMRWKCHLEPYFGHYDARAVNFTAIQEYINNRKKEKAENGTINREVAVIKRMFNLGRKAGKVQQVHMPVFPERLEENAPRDGFLKDAQYSKLADESAKEGLWLRAMLAVFYNVGWRRGEVVNLKVRQVDLAERMIDLDAGTTKNGVHRKAAMNEEMYTLLRACVEGKEPTDLVFTRKDGKDVVPVGDFRKTWENVCERAGVPGLLIHDLRRTAARNLRRLGMGESTAMKIGGWKTNSVFKRYDINDDSDLVEAARMQDLKRQQQEQEQQQAVTQGKTQGKFAPEMLQQPEVVN